jgi:hypothetical protein
MSQQFQLACHDGEERRSVDLSVTPTQVRVSISDYGLTAQRFAEVMVGFVLNGFYEIYDFRIEAPSVYFGSTILPRRTRPTCVKSI